ncbi:MAG: alpha/beta hydrolase [Desulfosarcinaceae bacterium]
MKRGTGCNSRRDGAACPKSEPGGASRPGIHLTARRPYDKDGKGFSDRFRLLIYDSRGQGESDLGSAPLSLKLHTADLKGLLYDLEIHRTALVGLSHGARVALSLADEAPELVSRLVLCSASTRANFRAKIIVRSWYEILRHHSLDAMVWASLPYVFGRAFLRQNEKLLDRLVKTIVRRNKTDALRAHLEALQNYAPLAGALKPLPFLVLVLTGEDDPLVTSEGAEEIARICGGRHVSFKNIGHSLAAEMPASFIRVVNDFLVE